MKTISVKLFDSGPVVREKMVVKDISYLGLWRPFCSEERNHSCNFGKGHYDEQFCEIVLNLLDLLFKDISYLELWQPLCLVEWTHLCNFGRRHHKEQF